MRSIYPLAAIVGQEMLKKALLVCAVSPSVGGVLIRGDKGSAKSTAARGLAELLPGIEKRRGCPFNCSPGKVTEVCAICNHPERDEDALRSADSSFEQKTKDGAASPGEIETVLAPFVNLPLGASEERVIGTLDLEKAIKEGKRVLQPGLLAAAHRGILYIDEINLLADHLVDNLLDVAAMGINHVQRDGISAAHPAQICLIGTMNDEEGALRPQLSDRFGMSLHVNVPTNPQERAEIVSRRLVFESDAKKFCHSWVEAQEFLRKSLVTAIHLLPSVILEESNIRLIAAICADLQIQSLRADIVMAKVAKALAALDGRSLVSEQDIVLASKLVLPHRKKNASGQGSDIDEEKLKDVIRRAKESFTASDQKIRTNEKTTRERGQETEDQEQARQKSKAENAEPEYGKRNEAREKHATAEESAHEQDSEGQDSEEPDTQNQDSEEPDTQKQDSQEQHTHKQDAADQLNDLLFAPRKEVSFARVLVKGCEAEATFGKRSTATASAGRLIRAERNSQPKNLALSATLCHSLARNKGVMSINTEDLHQNIYENKSGCLIILVVDASGSLAAMNRMEAVKGAALALLEDAYTKRDRIAVITFRGASAEIVMPPTASIELAKLQLSQLQIGGRTPLADALIAAERVIENAKRRDKLKPLLVLLSDGRANVASEEGQDPFHEAVAVAERLRRLNIPSIAVDTERGAVRMGQMIALAEAMGAEYQTLEEITSEALTLTIRQRLTGGGP